MSFDRGFIKWQPFSSVVSGKVIINDIYQNKLKTKPTLFPEEIEEITTKILEAYYSKTEIEISFYEEGQIKKVKAFIRKLHPNNNTIDLSSYKTIYFNQIISIS